MLVQTRKNFEALRTALLQAKIIAIDTETTGLEVWYDHQMIGVSLYCALQGTEYYLNAYLPFRHNPRRQESLFNFSENLPIEWLRELKPVFDRDDVEWVLHNAKFDMAVLLKEGVELKGQITDVGVLSHLVDENGSHKLKDLAAKYYGHDEKKAQEALKKLLGQKMRFAETYPKEMEEYACKDAELTYRLRAEFLPELHKDNLLHLVGREELFTHCLFEMERYGVGVDCELAKSLSDEANAQMRVIEDELGFDPNKDGLLARRLFAAPPDGLGLTPLPPLTKVKHEYWPDGIPSMTEETLSAYDNPVVTLVLRYRGLVKAQTTWFKKFLLLQARSADGRLHPTYNQNGTKTSRLSCSKPNVQQLPRKDETEGSHLRQRVRKLMIPASPGFELWEFDYEQIEQRLTTVYTDDEEWTQRFTAGEDPHQALANLLGVSRQAAKHGAYTTLYGGGAERLAETLERLHRLTTGEKITFPIDEAKRIIDGFFQLHPRVRRLMQTAERTARRQGYIKLWTGRRRHFLPFDAHKAFNSLIQGGAAELMKETMLMFHSFNQEPVKPPYRMVAQVHDSLWFEIPPDSPELHTEIKITMEWPTYDERFKGIPFPVDAKKLADAR